MGNLHAFREMKRFGEKLFTFSQDKAKAFQPADGKESADFKVIKGGACLALAVAWLDEKLHGRFQFSSSKDSQFTGRGAEAHRQNLGTLLRVAPDQYAYNTIMPDDFKLKQLLEAKRIRVADEAVPKPYSTETLLRHSYGGGDRGQTYDMAGSLVNVAARLKSGYGALVLMTVNNSGHAVALYKSHGDSLYFFCANCGGYKVKDRGEFFAAWVAGYRRANDKTLDFDAGKGDLVWYVARM